MKARIKRKIELILPIIENIELVAAQTVAVIAQAMNFTETCIDELQFALIEACINAFEYSNSPDKRVFITFLVADDALEMEIRDYGIGFQQKPEELAKVPDTNSIKKRGWGLQIIRDLMDAVTIQSSEKGTTVKILKHSNEHRK